MRILLTGGVFEAAMGAYALSAPENVLAQFLRARGHDVVGVSAGRRLGRELHGDVFHANHFGVAAYHLALAGVKPFVFTSHDGFLASGYDATDTDSRLETALETLVLRCADAVVALSSREADLLSARFGVPRDRFRVLPNGLDLALYGRGAPRPDDDGFALLSVGQLAEHKGHRYLIEAVAALAPRLPGLRLTIVTHRPDLRDPYEKLARGLGVADRISYEGPLDTPELVERYRACDVYVQPSLAEAFGITIVEAMACAKPVVASAVGGVPEVVGSAGVLVPAGDSEALVSAIERLARDADQRRRLGDAGLDLVARRYDGRDVARRHEELYAEVIARVGHERRGSLPRRALALAGLAVLRRKEPIARLVPEFVRRRPVAKG